jgi:hypothetical protein
MILYTVGQVIITLAVENHSKGNICGKSIKVSNHELKGKLKNNILILITLDI